MIANDSNGNLPAPPDLENCPFCGSPPTVIWRPKNPRAGCKTVDCWGSKLPCIALDIQEHIDAWNTRNGSLISPSTSPT